MLPTLAERHGPEDGRLPAGRRRAACRAPPSSTAASRTPCCSRSSPTRASAPRCCPASRPRPGRRGTPSERRLPASGTPPALMNTFGPPQAGARPRRGRARLGRRRQRVPRPARRHRRQRARPRPPGAGRGGHHPARHARPRLQLLRQRARRSSWPSGCSRLLGAARRRQGVLHQLRRRGQRGGVQADPAHRPHPRRRRRGRASTAARWARSR